jgi:hypothetical protein
MNVDTLQSGILVAKAIRIDGYIIAAKLDVSDIYSNHANHLSSSAE